MRVLFNKIGTVPVTRPIIQKLRDAYPEMVAYGVEENLFEPETVFDHVLTSHDDALFGSYSKVDLNSLSLDPHVYEEIRQFEGELLRMADRVQYHDQEKYIATHKGVAKYQGTFDDRSQLVLRHLLFWSKMFKEHKFDAIVAQNYGHVVFDSIIYRLAESRRIPFIFFNETRPFFRSLYMYESLETFGDLSLGRTLIAATSEKLIPNSEDRLGNMLSSVGQIDQVAQAAGGEIELRKSKYDSSLRSALITSGSEGGETSLLKFAAWTAIYQKFKRLFFSPIRTLKQVSRTAVRMRDTRRSMKDELGSVTNGELPENFVFFPLQSQPNATTVVKGGIFVEQREAIALIANNLPVGWKVVVKESPRQWRRLYPRRPKYWTHISLIPNCHVVSHEIESEDLIKKANALIEISYSSLILKALQIRKPAIVLGRTHLSGLDGVIPVESAEDLRKAFRDIKEGRVRGASSLVEFVTDTYSATLEGALSYAPQAKDPNDREIEANRTVHNVATVLEEWLRRRVIKIDG